MKHRIEFRLDEGLDGGLCNSIRHLRYTNTQTGTKDRAEPLRD
jgi:hypothetical protein